MEKMATELKNPGRNVFMEGVNTQNFWTFVLGTQEGHNIPIWMHVVFPQNEGRTIKI